jgi:hypothetical protein
MRFPHASIEAVKLEQYFKSSSLKVRILSPFVSIEHPHKLSVVTKMRISSPSNNVVTLGQIDKLSFVKA